MPSKRYIPEVDGPDGIGYAQPVGAAEEWSRALVHQRSRVEQAVIESYERSALSAADYCRQAIEIAESSGERTRRAMAHQRRMILYDAWRPLLISDIKNRLTKDLWKAVIGESGDYADVSRNAARAIWEEMAVLYKQPAARTTPGDNDASADAYKRLVRWSDFHPFWQSAEVQVAAFNDVIVYPTVRMRRGKKVLKHNAIAGDCCSAIFDPELTDGPAVLVFFYRYLIGDVVHTRWTVHTPWWAMAFTDDKARSRVNSETGEILDDDAPLERSPGGEDWPFVFIHRDPFHPYFWDQTSGTDLVDLTLKLGRRQTDDDYLWHRSAFKQLAVSGENVRTKGKTLLDPSALLTFRGADSITMIDWQPDFRMRQDCTNGEEIRAAASRGINPERLRRTGYQTAEGARLSERGLHERRERYESIFARAEDEYYHLCALIARAEGMDARPDPDMELEVVYGPIEYAGDPAKYLDAEERRARMGLQAVTDTILAEHPSWTREQAIDYMRRNVEELAEVSRIKQSAGVPDNDLANRSSDDERNGAKGPAVRDGNKADDSTGDGSPDNKPIGE